MLLPSPDRSLDSLVDTLTAEKFSAIKKSLEPQRVHLTLPKVEMRWGASVNDELRALGMPAAFDASRANFSRMTQASNNSEPLFLSDVLQQTYLRVDEKGTEAAAVSAVIVAEGAMMPRPPVEMNVDRPYIMAIVDRPSGAILFLAAVRDPRG